MAQMIIPVTSKIIENIMKQDILYSEEAYEESVGLNKGGLSDFNAALKATWTKISKAVNIAAKEGWEKAKIIVEQVTELVEECIQALGNRANEYRDRLIEKIQQSIADTYNAVLGSLSSELNIGNTNLPLKTVNIEYKMVFSGSVEVSLVTLCKLVASGEMAVKGTYELKVS